MFQGIKEIDNFILKLNKENKKVLAYAGFDPTGNSLHLGHLGVINILKKFENSGHQVVCLIGNGTAFIGDPTGKNEMRKVISENQIDINSIGIKNDILRVLPNTKFVCNEWLKRINLQDFLKDICSKIPLSQILNLSIVKTRLESKSGITLMEAIYPVLQGWDMVIMAQMAKHQGFDGIVKKKDSSY